MTTIKLPKGTVLNIGSKVKITDMNGNTITGKITDMKDRGELGWIKIGSGDNGWYGVAVLLTRMKEEDILVPDKKATA
jgi:hypothetical protein